MDAYTLENEWLVHLESHKKNGKGNSFEPKHNFQVPAVNIRRVYSLEDDPFPFLILGCQSFHSSGFCLLLPPQKFNIDLVKSHDLTPKGS